MASKARLSIGDTAVVAGNVHGNLRPLPNMNAPVGAKIAVGKRVRIIGGSCEPANGWVWWIVRVTDNDGVPCNDAAGWMNEWWINPDTGIGEYNLVKP